MKITLAGLQAQHQALRKELLEAVAGVLDKGVFILGEQVASFEREVAEYCGTRRAVGVASGADALALSMRAIGIGPGNEVITAAFTFMASASTIAQTGATPVFADIEEETFNISPAQIEAKLTPRTKALIPVHLFGQMADMDAIMRIAEQHSLAVIEDAAQAMGAEWRGQRAGSIGTAGCLSFYPTKNLPACGDAGMVVTQDDAVADRVRLLRACADASITGGKRYHYDVLGYNSRLDELQAALLRVKLRHLESWHRRRNEIAALYRELLDGCDLQLSAEHGNGRHVYNQFTIRTPRRDHVQAYLAEREIGTTIYYPCPLHLQKAFAYLSYREGDYPVAERVSGEVLSLPIYAELKDEQVEVVAKAVREALAS